MSGQPNYLTCMCLVRRICALAVVFAFAVSLAAHGVMAGEMGTKVLTSAAVAESSSGLSSNGCDGCGSSDGLGLISICFGLCTGSAAIMAEGAPIEPVAQTSFGRSTARIAVGEARAPDPSPPRQPS